LLGIRGGRDRGFVEEGADAAFDLVADRPEGGDVLAGGVIEHPFLVPLAGEDGAASPQPIL